MLCVTLLSVIVLSSPPQGEEAWAEKLGKERDAYGDIPNSGPWKHGYTGSFGGTYILFRAGSSTERYYLTTSPGAKRWRISRTTLVQGKIRKDWMIFIEDGKEPRITKPGPLWKWSEGGRVVGALPKMAKRDCESQIPLALYHSNVQASYCSFIESDGKESENTPWNLGEYDSLPKTDFPYPITPEEREYVYRKRDASPAKPKGKSHL